MDGAARGNPGPAGGGVIIRDQFRKWIKGIVANFGHCTFVKAELLALLKALKLAWTEGFRRVIFQVDS